MPRSAGETQSFPIGESQMPENLCPRESSLIIPSRASFLPEQRFGSQCPTSHMATGKLTSTTSEVVIICKPEIA